jgi:hypothetical protein
MSAARPSRGDSLPGTVTRACSTPRGTAHGAQEAT